MKTILVTAAAILLGMAFAGCGSTRATKKIEQIKPGFVMKPNESIAIMPFEAESALSNLGRQVSDEVIVNLLQHAPDLKIFPATVVSNYLLNVNFNAGGIPDLHTIQSLKERLKCQYLLTGNLSTSIGDIRYTATPYRIATGSVTVCLIDCDSSNVVWAKHVEASYTASYYLGSPYETDGQLLQGLIRRLGSEVAKNFYPSREREDGSN
jgi:TolB-like protein